MPHGELGEPRHVYGSVQGASERVWLGNGHSSFIISMSSMVIQVFYFFLSKFFFFTLHKIRKRYTEK